MFFVNSICYIKGFFVVFIFSVSLSSYGAEINVPLNVSSWKSDDISGPVTLEEVGDGIKFSGIGYREIGGVYTKARYDMRNGTIYVKWKPGDSVYAGFIVVIIHDAPTIADSKFITHGNTFFTTDHSSSSYSRLIKKCS